jgi:hypothetical protein
MTMVTLALTMRMIAMDSSAVFHLKYFKMSFLILIPTSMSCLKDSLCCGPCINWSFRRRRKPRHCQSSSPSTRTNILDTNDPATC